MLTELEKQLRFNDPKQWPTNGSHWSQDWGGSGGCWRYSIQPRLPKRSGRVIEVGCGHGQWIDAFTSSGWQYRGYDLCDNCIAYCKTRYLVECSQPAWDTEADLIWSWNSLVASPASTLVEIVASGARVLSDRGVMFLHHGDCQAEVAAAAIDAGLCVAVQERVDWPSGSANCWFATLTRQRLRGPYVVMASTLRDEMRVASLLGVYYS